MKNLMVAFMCFIGGIGMMEAEAEEEAAKKNPARFDFQLPESIEMPGGEIYYHPKVVEVRPNGISIMHDNGVAFWPFSQLPDNIRNKFHYNAAAAQKYTDEMLLRREHIDELKAKQKIIDAHHQVYRDMVSQRYQCTYLRMKIDALNRRIGQDKQNIQQLGNNINQDRKTIATEAAVSGNNNSNNGFWNNSSGTDNSVKMDVIGEFDQDWKNSKTDYEMWTFAKNSAQDNMATYQQEYKEAQDKLKSLEQQWAKIQAEEKHDQGQLDKAIHESVQKTVQDSMLELEKLRQMRNQQLITTDEYIRKKAEILKRF